MINCKPYQLTYTDDLKAAAINRDSAFFNKEIRRLCTLIASRTGTEKDHTEYDAETSRLQLCLALADSIDRHGDTTKLICDMINF